MAVKRQEEKLGRKLTKQEVAHVVHQSRPKKVKDVSDEQVRKQQLGEIGFFEKLPFAKWFPPQMASPRIFPNRSARTTLLTTVSPTFLNALGHAAA